MDNENEEEKGEEDKDAEDAYFKLTKSSLNKNDQDDHEFDYDENVFNTTSAEMSSTMENDSQNVNADNEMDQDNDKMIIQTSTSEALNAIEDNPHDTAVSNANCIPESASVVECPIDIVVSEGDPSVENSSSAEDGLWKKEHEAATEEWNQVEEIVITSQASTADLPRASTEHVSFNDAIEHYQSLNLREYSEKIRPYIQRSGIVGLCYSLIGPTDLSRILHSERDFIFTLALVKFDDNDEVCKRVLFTVYKCLTKIKVDCPRFGKHWENIGFQGNDPTTDLRGCGMLGLLTTLHFVTSKKTSQLAALVYHLSQDEMQHFPFCVMSINVTRIALQVLREGKLNKECNKRYKASKQANYQVGDSTGIVYEVFQELYVSIFNRIYTIWKNEYKTMAESGFVMMDVEGYAMKKPLELMKRSKKEKAPSSDDKIESFVGVDEL